MENLIRALVVTAEITGTDLSAGAAKVMVADLAEYPEEAVLKALKRCRREVRGRLVLSDIISRIDDGRPGVEEAWGMYPKDEVSSAVVTDEMHLAMRHAWPLLQGGDKVAARMAFKESYERIVAERREAGIAPKWEVTLGDNRADRERALVEAVEKRQITAEHAIRLLPTESHEKVLRAAGVTDHPLLAPPTGAEAKNQQRLSDIIQKVLPATG